VAPVLGERPTPGGPGFWNESLGPRRPSASALSESVDADVCIVGAGYTGLWTAWGLLRHAPDLRVVIVEARHVGFGASGRNGGWLSGLLPGNRSRLAGGPAGRAGVVALQRALVDAVGSVGSICASEGIDCDFNHGGTLAVGLNGAQMARLRAGVAEDRRWGLTDDDVRLLDGPSTAARVQVDGAVGSVFSPHCARIHPAKLVRGLAAAVERRGVRIFEGSPAVSAEPGLVRVRDSRVRAPWVVLATEGYTAALAGRSRGLLPMNSSMIVTAPLPSEAWEEIGWAGAETVSDGAHAYVYLQRTADDRIAIGGRGVPYRYGSRAARGALSGDDTSAATPAATVAALEAALRRMFPRVAGGAAGGAVGGAAGGAVGGAAGGALRAERAWSGVLGVARDWCPSILVQPAGSGGGGGGGGGAGLASAGGYVGDGVATAHLAGLTLADLILGHDTALTSLPWVGRRSPAWEPEPLRWLGVRTVYGLYRAADRSEGRRPERAQTSGWARVADRLAGRG
jgi:glycine/D-amino acid oxidase-like deaminating enzyme